MSTIPETNLWSIAGRGLKLDTAEDMAEHVAALAKYECLEEICLSGNTLGVEAAKALATALKPHTHLKVLSLSDIFTGRLLQEIPQALTAICDAVMDHPELHTLDLSDNAFGPAGAEPIVPFLSHRRSLRTLKLNNNGLGVRGGKFVASALLVSAAAGKAAGEPSALRTIIAGRNRLEDGSSADLAAAFAAHDLLEEVRLPQNGIRPDGVVNLAGGLSNCPNLRVFDLQDNTFTEKGSLALATALPRWPSLHTLNLGDCLLGSRGALAIARTLDCHPPSSLTHLNLQYNEIDDTPIVLIARALRRTPKIVSVELNGNRFAEDGETADAIRETLEHLDAANALGSLSDMEECSDEEGEEEEEEEVVPIKEEQVDDMDALADRLVAQAQI